MTLTPTRRILAATLMAASAYGLTAPAAAQASSDARFDAFAPRVDRIDHRIDYSIWTSALSNFVISMGPPLRKKPTGSQSILGTRQRVGHNSIYRLDGSMVGFSFMNDEVIKSFSDYRRDLESVADGLDIASLPRDEQLAYWLNLHNVAMVEQIAQNWPVRQPRSITIDGVPLDEARFITVNGVAMSPKDIRTKIVFKHWKDPRVIYGFWRGEIGGPAMQREAFGANTVSGMLDRAAREFTNSRRGVESRGSTLHVSTLYEEAAPYFFPNFAEDVRNHINRFANDEMKERYAKTSAVKSSIREYDIADLAGGRRTNPVYSNSRYDAAALALLQERQGKLEYLEREGLRTGTVTFSDFQMPGEDKKDAVE